MAMGGLLRCTLEKVGRRTMLGRGFNNRGGGGVKRMLCGFFGGAVSSPQCPPHPSFPRWSYFTRQITNLPLPIPFDDVHDVNRYTNKHTPAYMKYAQQLEASEGFDVDGGSDGDPIFVRAIHPYPGSMEDFAVTRPALFAVNEHNKQQETNLEFVRVVKMNLRILHCVENYITLEAIDNGVNNTYQAKVWLNAAGIDKWELQLFRLAPENHQPNRHIGTSCSVKNAMTVLRNLQGVKSCDSIFLVGAILFRKEVNRVMFLNGLQTDQERRAWLRWQVACKRGSPSKIDQERRARLRCQVARKGGSPSKVIKDSAEAKKAEKEKDCHGVIVTVFLFLVIFYAFFLPKWNG